MGENAVNNYFKKSNVDVTCSTVNELLNDNKETIHKGTGWML
ncbi:DNA alkylation repair protein [Enterococcus mediterraneensis]